MEVSKRGRGDVVTVHPRSSRVVVVEKVERRGLRRALWRGVRRFAVEVVKGQVFLCRGFFFGGKGKGGGGGREEGER